MRISAISLALAAVLAVGCTESSSVPTSESPVNVDEVCQVPPEPQQTIPDPEFDLTITPNPASPGAKADLVIEAANDVPQTPEDLIATGAGALFQCWDGSSWINISQLLKNGFGPDNKPAAIDLSPGVTVTIPAVALLIADQPFTIVLPNVSSGVYRIEDSVIVGSRQRPVYELVEIQDN